MSKNATNNKAIVIERSYNAPIDKVWKAITNKDEMKQWYFDIAEFKPEIGFEFQFFGESDGKKYLHLCKVTEMIKGKKIAYSWCYDGYEGNSTVSFELFAEGGRTRLKLTHQGIDTFSSIEAFAKENFVGGWKYFLDEALNGYLG
ncbi:MAG: SRPBCC family protein [Candidatus Hodarchaeales archaeon]|jgi:uncharacterized protein YndB with AHSA1/START domain